MDALIQQATEFIRQNQVWAGPIIGLLTFGESMFLVGILIPATALLLVTGGLVASGTLPLLPILLWGYAGALLGDALSFWLGRWLGPRVLRYKPLRTHRRTVARARLLFFRYGFFAVLLGRFLGPIRSTIPTVAGVMGMPELKFQAANFISALFWVPGLLMPGYMAIHAAESLNIFKLF
jgi:membrane protein DedA with SNARE-associated domain